MEIKQATPEQALAAFQKGEKSMRAMIESSSNQRLKENNITNKAAYSLPEIQKVEAMRMLNKSIYNKSLY